MNIHLDADVTATFVILIILLFASWYAYLGAAERLAKALFATLIVTISIIMLAVV